jgi:hypothetical protein
MGNQRGNALPAAIFINEGDVPQAAAHLVDRLSIISRLHQAIQLIYLFAYHSWLNQVEIWFNIIAQKAIRWATFRSAKDLVAKIENVVAHYNAKCSLFRWTATGDFIFDNLLKIR